MNFMKMKKNLSLIVLCCLAIHFAFSQSQQSHSQSQESQTLSESNLSASETQSSQSQSAENQNSAKNQQENSNVELDPKTGFPVIKEKPFVMFNYGFADALITRLELQEERSNFVRQTSLLGAYVSMQTVNIKPINNYTRLAIYYPFYNTFNGMKQSSKQKILGAVDLFWGPMFEADMWKYILIKSAAGLHFMYQRTDEFDLLYLGLGLMAGFELPVAKNWTILANGSFSLDYPNLGSNSRIQPYDYAWTYQIDFGFRYSKKGVHKYSYIH